MKKTEFNVGKRKIGRALLMVLAAAGLASGCKRAEAAQERGASPAREEIPARDGAPAREEIPARDASPAREPSAAALISPGPQIQRLEDGFSVVGYDGDYWFDQFLEAGGAVSDGGVIGFLAGRLELTEAGLGFATEGFGCSTLAARSPEGSALFGRNFDWEICEALVVRSDPPKGRGVMPPSPP